MNEHQALAVRALEAMLDLLTNRHPANARYEPPRLAHNAAIDAAIAAVNAAFEDAARLDLLSAIKGDMTICSPGNHGGRHGKWLVVIDDEPYRGNSSGYAEYTGDTLREALDCARKERV